MTTQGIEAGTGETERLDTKCESPVAESDAPDHPTDWQNRAYRAEAECKELREQLRLCRAAAMERLIADSADEITPSGHAWGCAWHLDQYEPDCTCGHPTKLNGS